MAKFHIGENGPAKCRAFVRACPVGGDHFDTKSSAQKEYERQLRVQYHELQSHNRASQSREAAQDVARRIAKAEGTTIPFMPVLNLKEGDVLPDGRVVDSVEDERHYHVEGREDAGIGVYFKNEYSEFPPGFSYDHFPSNAENIDDVHHEAHYTNVFRPGVVKRERLSTPGQEVRDNVSVEDLLPGDELPDGRTVVEVDSMRDMGLKTVVLYFEDEDGFDGGSGEFPLDLTFDNVFLDKPR